MHCASAKRIFSFDWNSLQNKKKTIVRTRTNRSDCIFLYLFCFSLIKFARRTLMDILPNAEKQGELAQLGGWQKEMARRRYQKGSTRKRGKRNPVWELQFWTDVIKTDGKIGRTRESVILGPCATMTRRQALKAAEEHLRPLNLGKITPYSSISLREFAEKYFITN